MTSKEKAIELICKYNLFDLDKIKSKQCAFIAVDEIIELENFSVEGREYWNEVKNEIINL